MKEQKRIKFHSKVGKGTVESVLNELSSFCEPIIADDYDYYFAIETIYSSKQSMSELLCSKPSAIRIMLSGEAFFPDLNLFDYVIWHNTNYICEDRVLYQPLGVTLIGDLFDSIDELDCSKKNKTSSEILLEKSKFCNFMYSNPNAHYMRDQMFYSISEYKHVDSLGRHLKNVNIEDTRYADDWYKKSVAIKRPYKFSIAAENAAFPGYTSEKIMTSMMANTIPLYFGNPHISDVFNEESFINVNSFSSMESFVRFVAEVDNDDSLYCSIMDKPWRTKEQIIKYNEDVDLYKENLQALFEQDIQKAHRRPRGTWPDTIYPRAFQLSEELEGYRFRGYLKKTAEKLLHVLRG